LRRRKKNSSIFVKKADARTSREGRVTLKGKKKEGEILSFEVKGSSPKKKKGEKKNPSKKRGLSRE